MLGLGLRVWNARTAHVHFDELHYTADGQWMTMLPVKEWPAFLRSHSHPHPRLDPVTGQIGSWSEGVPHVLAGHPALFVALLGPVLAFNDTTDQRVAARSARYFVAVADASAVPLLAVAALRLGLGPVTALATALLYASSPTAATYGSLVYLDGLLALWTSAVLLTATLAPSMKRALLLGLLSSLMIATKPTGVPAAAFCFLLLLVKDFDLRRVLAFTVTCAVLTAVMVDPIGYITELRYQPGGGIHVRHDLLANLRDNITYLLDFDRYYWLGFGQHGYPLAPALARANRVLTPAYFALMPLGFWALARRRGAAVALAVAAPLLAMLASIPASNGIWRYQIGMPLLCFLVACALTAGGPRLALTSAIVAVLASIQPLLPLRPTPTGDIELASVLFANPDVVAQRSLFNPLKGRPFYVGIGASDTLTRRLWLPPGRYRVIVNAEGRPFVAIDDVPLTTGPDGTASVELVGHVHALRIESPQPSSLYRMRILAD